MVRFRSLLALLTAIAPVQAQNWERVIASPGITASAIGAGNGNTIYAGLRSGDVYRSDDNGRTWQPVNTGLVDGFGTKLTVNAFAQGANGRIVRGGNNGSWNNRVGSPIFYSDNQGTQWTESPLPFGSPASNPAGVGVSDMVAHQGALYFSDMLSAGVWKSTDNGVSWVSVGDSLPAVPTGGFGPPTKTYNAIASSGSALLTAENFRGVHRSTDGGATWSQSVNGIPGVVNSPLVGGRTWSATDIAGAPDGTAVAVVDSRVYVSRDAGATWSEVGSGLFNARKVEFSNGGIYVATLEGNPSFFESTDLGLSWRRLPGLTSGAMNPEVLSQRFTAHNGALYFAGSDGVYRLDLATATRTDLPPQIQLSRTGTLLANVGGTLQLNATVQGSAPFTYEWRLNGTPIPGQTSASLLWALSATNQSGEVSLVVSNPAGSVTIVAGSLTVAPVGVGLPDYSFLPQVVSGGFLPPTVMAFSVDLDGSVFYGGENLWSISGDTFRGLRHAFSDGRLDLNFVTGLVGGNGTGPGTGSPVRTLLPLGDGSVLVGAAGTGSNDRYWRRMLPDGSLDAEWPWPESMAGGPYKVMRLADGKLLVASGSLSGIHRLNPDGTIDPTFNLLQSIGTFQRNYVRDFALQPDGSIIITGFFDNIDGVQRRSIARLFTSGGLDQSFVLADIGSGRLINVLLRLSDGKLLIGGNFTTVGGQPRSSLARLNADGTLDTSFPNLALNAQVFAFALQDDGKIWMGGGFSGLAGRSYLVRLNPDGSVDESIPDLKLNGIVQKLELAPDGKLWIGSAGSQIAGYPGGHLVRIFTDLPTKTIGYPGRSQTPNAGTSITLNGTATGPYTSLQWRFNGVLIAGATSLSLPLNNLTVANSGTYDFVIQSAGGSYTTAPVNIRVRGPVVLDLQPQPAVGLISNSVSFASAAFGQPPLAYQWLKDGLAIAGATNRLFALTNLSLLSAGDYVVRVTGADGSVVDSEPAFLTVIPVPGTRDLTFGPRLFNLPPNIAPAVNNFRILPDGRFLVMGQFAAITNGPLTRLARLNSDGSLDETFNLSGSYSEVLDVLAQRSGRIIMMARLNEGGGPYEVRGLRPDGTLDPTFATWRLPGFPGEMTLGADDSIYVAHSRVTRLSPDGLPDTLFESKATFNASVGQLSIDEHGRIYVAGGFSQVSGQPRRYFARLLADGSLDGSFVPPANLPLPTRVQAVPGGVLYNHRDGLWRFNEDGTRDLTWQFTRPLPQFDLLPDGSIAGINQGQGIIIDSQGRPAKPVSSFLVPQASQGYSQFRVAPDASFYLSQALFAAQTNILIHLSGTVVPIALVTHPVGSTVNAGETFTLRSAAIGTSAVSYQWQRNGVDLPGETGANLVISNAQMNATAEYRVIVRNRSGSVTSRIANVVVLGSPEIISLSSDTTVGFADRLVIEVAARGLAPLSYQWRRNGAALSGATNASYTNVSATLADSGSYDVVITNPAGSITSSPINVSVVVVPGAVVTGFAPTSLNGADELAVLPDGRILVGSKSGGVSAYSQEGVRDPSFAIVGANNTDWREKIAIDAVRGRAYISPSSTLRAVDFSGQPIPGFSSPPINTRIVRVEQSGTILVSDNGINPSLQRLDANGTVVPGLAPAIIPVLDFRPTPEGKILVLSSRRRTEGFNFVFDTVVMRLNSNGTQDTSFVASTNVFVLNQEATGLALDRQGRILVLGAFEKYLQQPRTSLVRLNPNGTLDETFVPAAINGGVLDVSEQENGKLVIVGAFTHVGGVPRNRVARLHPDGSHDVAFDPGTGLTSPNPGQVIGMDVEVLPNGQIVVAGIFSLANDLPRQGLVMLTGGEPTGQTDPFAQWATEAGLSGANAAPGADPDGDGIPNQAEFAYGTSPTSATSRPTFTVATLENENQRYPSVTFSRRAGATVNVQASRSVSFQTLADTVETVGPAVGGMSQVTVRAAEPLTGPGALFFRIVAE